MREGILDSRQPLSSLQLCTSLLHQICSTHRLNCGGVCAIRNRPVPRHRCPADAMQRQRDEQRQPNKRHAPCPLPRPCLSGTQATRDAEQNKLPYLGLRRKREKQKSSKERNTKARGSGLAGWPTNPTRARPRGSEKCCPAHTSAPLLRQTAQDVGTVASAAPRGASRPRTTQRQINKELGRRARGRRDLALPGRAEQLHDRPVLLLSQEGHAACAHAVLPADGRRGRGGAGRDAAGDRQGDVREDDHDHGQRQRVRQGLQRCAEAGTPLLLLHQPRYATQGSNTGLADPRQARYSHA